MTIVLPAEFPLDWDAWRLDWLTWRTSPAAGRLLAEEVERTDYFPAAPNFLADEILGAWRAEANGLFVELSEVQIMGHRYVGVTWAAGAGRRYEAYIVASLAELEHALLTDPEVRA
jgi:hypothetical protein